MVDDKMNFSAASFYAGQKLIYSSGKPGKVSSGKPSLIAFSSNMVLDLHSAYSEAFSSLENTGNFSPVIKLLINSESSLHLWVSIAGAI